MAKRKSLNRRLSRYSKHSIGSAILDPDTETLGDEYPYWWKNVENNTIIRPSIDSNVLNQTSRHLDSNSQIETSEAEDEWWKVLEDSNTSKTLQMKMNIAKNAEKDASNNNTSTSESLGEVKIARKRFRMRSKPKTSRDNAFLNALDASTATSTVEFGQADGRKGSTGNSASVGATVTNLKNKDETEENSFNQSQKSTAVLKLKPKIFNKNYKNNDKNLFYDVLKESKLQISSREGSKDKLQTVTNSSVANSARSDNSALSLEDANDIPHVFVPEAQSTILEGSTSSTHDSNSDIIRRVFEKKTKLLTRYKANIKRNLFEDTLEGHESTDEVRKSDLIKRNDATGGEALEQSARSSRISEASGKDVRKIEEHASLPLKNTNEFPESNVLAKTSVTSSDTLVLSRDFRGSPKTRIKVVTRLDKQHSGQVQFKNLLEESDSIDKDLTARSKDLLHLPGEENLAFNNVEPVRNKNDEVGESDSRNSAESRNFYLNLSYTSSDSKLSSLQKQVFQRDASEIFQANNLEISRKRKSGDRKRSELVSPIAEKDKSAQTPDVSPTRITENKSEEAKSDPRKNSGKKSRTQEKLVSPVEKEKDISAERENIAKRRSDWTSQSTKLSSYGLSAAVFEGKESEGENPKQSSRRQSSTRELVSPVGVDDDLEEREEDISDKQTDRSSKSIKRHSLRLVSSDSEADENKVDMSPRVSSRKQRRTREELVAPVGTGGDLEESGKDILKQQTDRLSKSKIYSLRSSMRVSEVEDVENTPQRNTRSRSKVSVGSVSSVTEQNRTAEAQDISTRQSDRPSKPIKHSFGLTSSDSEADENKAGSPKRSSRKESSTRELVSPVGVKDDLEEREEDISKQRTDRLSKSKIYSLRSSMRASEVKDDENTPEQSTRSRSKVSLGSVSSVTEQNRTTEGRDIFKKRSDLTIQSVLSESEKNGEENEDDEAVEDMEKVSSSKARKRLTLSSRDEMEPEEAENTAKRQKRNSNRIQARQSFSEIVSKIDQGNTARKSNSANISEKQVVIWDREKAVAESQDENSIVQQKVSKSRISVLEDSNVEKVREGVNRGNESLSGPIKEINTTEMSKTHNDSRDGGPSKFDDGNSVNEREENARNVSRDKGIESKLQRDTNEGINRLTRSVADKEQHFRESGGKVSGSKATNLTPSTRTRKLLSSNVLKGQQSIESFFDSVRRLPESGEVVKKVSLEDVNKKLEKVKEWAMSRVNIRRNNEGEARAVSKQKRVKEGGGKKANPIAQRRPIAKQIHKAFLVNGQVYKVPRLPRPMTWITDRLYNYLWKRLESKYKLQTRVVSEKFIIQLSNVATLIIKRKLYDNYKAELHALMKEMARLGLISTRKDFYDFCHEFFPYELRVKIVPMLLPGNKRNIPYNASNLHTPLLADK
ncbi:hypothetical protein ANTQUA_LOCUS3391 [Anthophora quadrimaculata]